MLHNTYLCRQHGNFQLYTQICPIVVDAQVTWSGILEILEYRAVIRVLSWKAAHRQRLSVRWKRLMARMPHHMTLLNTGIVSLSVVGHQCNGVYSWVTPFCHWGRHHPASGGSHFGGLHHNPSPTSSRCQDKCGVCGKNHSWPFSHAEGVWWKGSQTACTFLEPKTSWVLPGTFGQVPRQPGVFLQQTYHSKRNMGPSLWSRD